ncbi:hypothetical protein [Polaribacter atrinae]|uniref:hypothetical protein n=1 Tax=Polaribacter atrinae TaxID=1333662 RepID=UPI0030F929AC
MKLTQTHIEELYKFTKKHYVEYYDVQTELVDHLANDIETICLANPKLSFDDARDTSFKKFGIFGFMDVVEQKQSQMTKKYFKIILNFAKEWFKLPKIILTALLFIGFYQLQNTPNAYTIYSTVFGFIFLAQVILTIINARKLKKEFKTTKRKWLFKNIINVKGLIYAAFISIYSFQYLFPNNTKDFLLMGDFRKAFSAFFITFLVIFGYITLVVIPKKAEELLEETYPEYKLI